jgi:hypothetical protein
MVQDTWNALQPPGAVVAHVSFSAITLHANNAERTRFLRDDDVYVSLHVSISHSCTVEGSQLDCSLESSETSTGASFKVTNQLILETN